VRSGVHRRSLLGRKRKRRTLAVIEIRTPAFLRTARPRNVLRADELCAAGLQRRVLVVEFHD
jgi:hypothetical protein